MARLGRNEQLVVVGAGIALLAYLLGVFTSGWSITLSAGTVLVGSAIAAALTFMGSTAPSILGVRASSFVRVVAALVVAFALIDLGDVISSFSDWGLLDIVFTAVYVVGAAILAYGAWAVSGGSLLADAQGPRRVMKMEMVDRFVYAGALGTIIGWFLLMAVVDIYNFNAIPSATVFLATLVLAVRWLERNPDAGKLPLPSPWTIAGLAALTVILGLLWFVGIIGRTVGEGLADIGTWIVLILYLLSLASLGVGAFLSIGGVRTSQPVA